MRVDYVCGVWVRDAKGLEVGPGECRREAIRPNYPSIKADVLRLRELERERSEGRHRGEEGDHGNRRSDPAFASKGQLSQTRPGYRGHGLDRSAFRGQQESFQRGMDMAYHEVKNSHLGCKAQWFAIVGHDVAQCGEGRNWEVVKDVVVKQDRTDKESIDL